jgi:hypothetical protein
MLWYRKGYNWTDDPHPPLNVYGKNLDGSAPPFTVEGAYAAGNPPQYFMTMGLNIPSAGCWEITGTYRQDKLTFIVWVKDGSLPRVETSDGHRKIPTSQHPQVQFSLR